jgi:hypothetical protein
MLLYFVAAAIGAVLYGLYYHYVGQYFANTLDNQLAEQIYSGKRVVVGIDDKIRMYYMHNGVVKSKLYTYELEMPSVDSVDSNLAN